MLVEKKDNQRLFAIKILKKDIIAKRNQKIHTQAERNILQEINHPFIVGLHYAFQNSSKLYLVMDFMQGGFIFIKILIFLENYLLF